MTIRLLSIFLCLLTWPVLGQRVPYILDADIYHLTSKVRADRIENDIRILANFGTRHTLSDTISTTRGIGAARRWIYQEFIKISEACGGCLEVSYQYNFVPGGEYPRIPQDAWVVNVIAILRGNVFPNRYIGMAGDIDSRISDPLNFTNDSPGANDNASGIAGLLEAARVLTTQRYSSSILFLALSGEEQGLVGGKYVAQKAKAENWDLIGVINNDMIGNISGIDGVTDSVSFRIFSEPVPVDMNEQQRIWNRFYGGEVDGPSRQLARYIEMVTRRYLSDLEPILIYRLDRFGRGGHHRPFNDAGYAAVRVMETHEHYDRQHQDLRVEDGRAYGDVIEFVNFNYAAKLTGVNIITLASLASAPPPPTQVMIGGMVTANTQLVWNAVEAKDLAGYKVYWRETTSPVWQYSRWAGLETEITLENVIIDNYLFGVASVSKSGHESLVQFPLTLMPRTGNQ